MPFLPRRGLLAIATVVDISLNENARPLSAKVLAQRYHLASRHLEPLLQALVHAGLLKGIRGPRGGYSLGRQPDQITLSDILAATMPDNDETGLSHQEPDVLGRLVIPVVGEAERAMSMALDNLTVDHLMRRAAEYGVTGTTA